MPHESRPTDVSTCHYIAEEKCWYDRMQNHPPGISATFAWFDWRHVSIWVSPCQLVPLIAFWYGKLLIFLKFAGDFWWHVTVILRLPTIDSSQSYLPSSISHRFTLHPLCARRASNGMGGTIENDNQCTGNKTNENKRTNVTICSYHLYNHSRLCNGFKLSHVYTRLLFVELTHQVENINHNISQVYTSVANKHHAGINRNI